MKLLERADVYFSEWATRQDVMPINYLKGTMSIEYAKLCKKSAKQKRNYNIKRGEVYKKRLQEGKSTSAAINDARTEADALYWDYEVYEEAAKWLLQVMKALESINIGLHSEEKHLSDIK